MTDETIETKEKANENEKENEKEQMWREKAQANKIERYSTNREREAADEL